MNITLIGMPASGKTQVGKKLSEELGYTLIDPDKILEAEYARPLQEILEELGDTAFLAKEAETLRTATRGRNKCIIATGGSAVYTESLMEYLADISFIIYLDASLPVITRRIEARPRGIVGSKEKTLEQIFDERTPLYKKWANVSINTDGEQEEIIANLIKILPERDQ